MTGVAEHGLAALTRIVDACGCSELLVAFSGGCDSTVLLRLAGAFAKARGIALRALHVDHGLHPDSSRWADHCLRVAAQLDAPCVVVRLDGAPPSGASVEAWARDRRYECLGQAMGEGGCVITAHHGDDQAETVLQRVLSGSGPHGLAAMSESRTFARGFLARPLIRCDRTAIEAHAAEHRLTWLEDPANRDERFLRNRLRHEMLPMLEAAYPGAGRGLRRLAALQANVARIIDRDVDDVLDASHLPNHQLDVERITNCDPALQGFVLKKAIERAALTPPGHRHLTEIMERLCPARMDANPVVAWDGNEVRRYRNRLYFMRGPLPLPDGETLQWDMARDLGFEWGALRARHLSSCGIALDPHRIEQGQVEVAFRRGGERCRPLLRGHEHRLKGLFQEWGVPPWERPLIPLIYIDGELAAVASLCICEGFAAPVGEEGIVLEWSPSIYASGV